MAGGGFSVREALRSKHVLLTGVTGFLGKVWLCMILARVPEIGKVTVLLRKKGGKTPLQRMEEIVNASPAFKVLHEAHESDLERFLASKLEVIEGDVDDPQLGLRDEDVRRLSGKIDLILNCAGLVDFHADLRKAYRTNVRGSLHALELARSWECPLLHVSTAFVAGARDGRVSESPVVDYAPSLPGFRAEADVAELDRLVEGAPPSGATWVEAGLRRAEERGWPNVYSYTKSLAESLLLARAGGVPVSLFRPTIVESAREFPFPGWNEGITTCAPLSFLLSRWTRVLQAKPSHHLDMVPVDTVCEGLTVAASALVAGKAKPVYHCGTSDMNPLSLRFAVELMGLSHREYERNNGKRSFEKKILSRMEPLFVGEKSFFTPEKMRRAATLLLEAADLGAPHVPDAAKGFFEFGRKMLRKARWDLIKAERVVEAFHPYLSRYDYRFATENLKSHAVQEPEFRFCPEAISWSQYIVRVHEPGLRKWCYPLMEGGRPEIHQPRRRCRLAPEETISNSIVSPHSYRGKHGGRLSAKGL